MPRADALVAEDPADLVDLFDAADQQPLQVQLQGDAQEQVDVEGVVVRDERPGRGAAGDGVQRRRLHLEEAAVVEVAADGADDQHALAGAVERLRVVDQVEVAVAQAELHVLHSAPLVRVRLQRLGQDRQAVGEHRRLAAARLAVGAVDADQVAEVEQLGQLPAGFADLLLAEHHLDAARQVGDLLDFSLALALDFAQRRLAGPVLHVEEVDLAALAAADDAAGDAHARPLVLRHVGREGEDFLNRLMAVETAAPRVEAQRLDGLQLLGTAGLESILGFGHGCSAFVQGNHGRCVMDETWIVMGGFGVSIARAWASRERKRPEDGATAGTHPPVAYAPGSPGSPKRPTPPKGNTLTPSPQAKPRGQASP